MSNERIDKCSLPEGHATLSWPAQLSQQSASDLLCWLNMMCDKVARIKAMLSKEQIDAMLADAFNLEDVPLGRDQATALCEHIRALAADQDKLRAVAEAAREWRTLNVDWAPIRQAEVDALATLDKALAYDAVKGGGE